MNKKFQGINYRTIFYYNNFTVLFHDEYIHMYFSNYIETLLYAWNINSHIFFLQLFFEFHAPLGNKQDKFIF